MDGILAVPVSPVGADWIDAAFRPQLETAVTALGNGGIIWLHVDAGAEGDYLLTCAEEWAKHRNHRVEQIRIFEHDPFLIWEELLGTPDQSPMSWSWSSGTIVSFENGAALPLSFLRERTSILATYCRARSVILIVPVLHGATRYIQESGDLIAHITAPPFDTVDSQRRRELVDALIRSDMPALPDDLGASLADQILRTDPAPVSRTEIQAWTEFYRDQPDMLSALRNMPPPPVARHLRLPHEVPTVDVLRSGMNAVEDAFRRAGNGFQKWSGRELFREAYQQLDPLQSSDPVHWFSAIVSHLSCLIESADSAWHALVQYEYNAATGDIEAGSAPDFYRVLGRIRTSLQHTLSPNRASDRDSIAVVRDWYFNGCGTDIPARYHWRTLTNLLIQGVRVAPERLALCVEKIPVCSARSIVESQIELYARRLSREDWRAHILASVQALAPELDVDRVLEKYLPELQEGLGKSAAAIDQVIKKARELAEAVVILEAARCPVSPRDLVDMGIKPGPQLGVFHRRIELEWQRDPQQTREHLLQVALALVEKF